MKKKQTTFTFSKFANQIFDECYISPIHITPQDEFIEYWNKRGYICKATTKKVIYVSAELAKANVPLKERTKLQEDINNSPIDESVQYIKKEV